MTKVWVLPLTGFVGCVAAAAAADGGGGDDDGEKNLEVNGTSLERKCGGSDPGGRLFASH